MLTRDGLERPHEVPRPARHPRRRRIRRSSTRIPSTTSPAKSPHRLVRVTVLYTLVLSLSKDEPPTGLMVRQAHHERAQGIALATLTFPPPRPDRAGTREDGERNGVHHASDAPSWRFAFSGIRHAHERGEVAEPGRAMGARPSERRHRGAGGCAGREVDLKADRPGSSVGRHGGQPNRAAVGETLRLPHTVAELVRGLRGLRTSDWVRPIARSSPTCCTPRISTSSARLPSNISTRWSISRAPSTVSAIVTSQDVGDVTVMWTSALRRVGAAIAEANVDSTLATVSAHVISSRHDGALVIDEI